MPKGIPKAGYRRTNKLYKPELHDIERRLAIRVPNYLDTLESLTKPVSCPNCQTVVKIPDRDSIIYLCDRAMGKPVQKQEVDVVKRIQLDADQIAGVISKNLYGFLDYLTMNHPVELAQYVEERRLLIGGSNNVEGTS